MLIDITKIVMDVSAAFSLKATYRDIRYETVRDKSLSYTEGTTDPAESSYTSGWSIWPLIDGTWGFTASDGPAINLGDALSSRLSVNGC
jgi:predicted Zn-dependent protease